MFGYHGLLLGQANHSSHVSTVMVDEPAGLLAILLGILATIFWLVKHPTFGRLFKVVPAIVFCYFVPTLLTTLGVIPKESPLYSWVKDYVLPASLLLLIIALDLPAIVRLGGKAIIMLLAGTFSIVIGGPLALWVAQSILPESWALPVDAWRGLAALSGSWIGGGANFVAIGHIAETSESMMALMVVPDVLVANIWMGVLLYMSGQQKSIDRQTGANAQAIRDLEVRMTEFHERTNRIATMSDLLSIVALGFVGSWVAYSIGMALPEIHDSQGATTISHSTWKYIIVTSLGVGLSFTRVRNLEGAGASKIGSVMIYLLIACIGASANFREIIEAPGFIVVGFLWMFVHISIILTVGILIRAPVFLMAVGSQANIGGAASAPVVAAAFHPSLAPVGALLAVAGYVLGTYAGLVCMHLLKWVAGAG